MIYTAINFRHSASPAESRIVEDFLLQVATTKQNVLQMSSPVNRDLPVPTRLRERLPKLLELGIIERRAHGRSYLLSQRFYQFAGKSGAYTRRKGLDKETNKELLLKHIKRNKAEGSPFRDLQGGAAEPVQTADPTASG